MGLGRAGREVVLVVRWALLLVFVFFDALLRVPDFVLVFMAASLETGGVCDSPYLTLPGETR